MTKPPLPLAVVLGLSPTGLHVVRSLGRAGVKVVGVAEGFQAGRSSRHLTKVIVEPDPIQRLEAICALTPQTPPDTPLKPVLIPTSDQDVDFVITHSGRLAQHFAFQDSYSDGLAMRILSKDSFYALCDALGISYPRIWETTRENLISLAADLPFPVMIKPARIHAIKDKMQGQKGWTVTDAAALRACVGDIPDGAGNLLVQEVVPGPESAITLVCVHVDRKGRMRQIFTARKLRQFPPGFGSASLVQSAPEPDSAAIATEFLAALGYRGIAAAEFKRHSVTGLPVIIEINVRPSLWFAVSQAANRPVVLSAYRELAGLPDDLLDTPQADGVRWRYALKDAWSARFYRRNPDFLLPPPQTEVVGPALRTIGAVYSADDPIPVLAEVVNLARKAVVRAVTRLGLIRTKGDE